MLPSPVSRTTASFDIGAGRVEAYTSSDAWRAIGTWVQVPNDFWGGWERYSTPQRGAPDRRLLSSSCLVVGECIRHFLHPDGSRTHTYIIEHETHAYPIKAAALKSLLPNRTE